MSDENDSPVVLFAGFHGKDELNIIRDIIGEGDFTGSNNEGIECYKWLIDNKYYEAEVRLARLTTVFDVPESISDSVEAIVVYFDPYKNNALEDVGGICKVFSSVDVKLLVCDGFLSDCDTSVKHKEWCIEHSWELVELFVESDNDDDLEDDFADSYGITRIKQALNAHTWSNLKLKSKNPASLTNLISCVGLSKAENSDQKSNKDFNEKELDSFCSLYGSLSDMKQRADALPREHRKDFAEKMAFAFLKSLNQDSDSDCDCDSEEQNDSQEESDSEEESRYLVFKN